MRILLSAFACAPNTGSEGGGGWRWALELARQHEVVVITDASRRAAIEEALGPQAARANPRIVYFRPVLLRGVPLNSLTAQLLYSAWQYSLLPYARRLHRQHRFDLAIHLTYGVFRHPSFLGFLGIPFVFGPVGGGEDAPWRLKRSLPLPDKFREVIRSLLNLSAKLNPFLWLALSRAHLILVRTPETARALPYPFDKRAVTHQEIGTPAHQRSTPLNHRTPEEPLQLVFAGRLLAWKGIHLALHAIARARAEGAHLRLTIIGSGPRETWLKALAEQLELGAEVVEWIPRMPQNQLFARYEEAHALIFPSLHDSGGNVVLEAMAFGLPVICLDLGGPRTLVDERAAMIVPTTNRDETAVVHELTEAVLRLARDEPLRQAMSQAALERAETMAWEKRIADAMHLISEHCPELGHRNETLVAPKSSSRLSACPPDEIST